jgi:acetylornithine deacetylase/succinyl-diaminopimelate desuccinylase-like protein
MKKAIEYAAQHQDRFLDDLIEFVRIPSISTLPEHKEDMQRAAQWIAGRLESLGFKDVTITPTKKHPVVFGQWMDAGKDAPTVLVYGHYDVQPADPLELWESEPFEPTRRGDNLYARGVSDMKAQLVAHLSAVEAMLKTSGLPVNLKYMLEGQEEVGSPYLDDYIKDNKDRLSCDFCLNVDAGILSPEQPSITTGLRGLSYFQIDLTGASGDMHSGTFGGAVDNPANVLARLITGMKDAQGHITLPGFYDDVREITQEELDKLHIVPDEWWLEQSGAKELFGEPEYPAGVRAAARPTLDVNGLLSGFTGEGSKTVLPATAMAKISMRLVPDQNPERIRQIMENYLKENVPETMAWTLTEHASSSPAMVEVDSAAVKAANQAFEDIWGKSIVFVRQGGTIPAVGYIQDILGADSLLLGFGLPDDNLHAPNEKQYLPNFFQGIQTYISFSHHAAG